MANRISILIITYNRPADLLALLVTLSTQNKLDEVLEEILILNNASTDNYDEVTAYAQSHPYLKINYIFSDVNLGVAKGRSTLMPMAKGDLLLTLDDDVVFNDDNSIYNLSKIFDKPFFRNANTAILTPRVIYYDTKEVQKTAFPHKKYEKYATKPHFLTSYYIGCAHILKKEILNKTGLYPEDFHYGMEEYDLSYRVLNTGYTIGYDNEVTIEHKESPLGRQPNYKKLQMQWVNKSKVAWRYLPFKYFLTTSISWSMQYLKNAKGHLGTYFLSWLQILSIPFTEKRRTINKRALQYLKEVEARLKF